MPGAQHMRDEGTRTVTAGKAGTAMETTNLGAFAHGEKRRTWTSHEPHRDYRVPWRRTAPDMKLDPVTNVIRSGGGELDA